MDDKKGKLDKFLSKLTSRKLAVFIVATVGLFLGVVDTDNWAAISLCYIGSEALADIAAMFKFGKKASTNKQIEEIIS
jgi:ABC-type Co2+ transport system permease subunit